jgi:hypothetical protein
MVVFGGLSEGNESFFKWVRVPLGEVLPEVFRPRHPQKGKISNANYFCPTPGVSITGQGLRISVNPKLLKGRI